MKTKVVSANLDEVEYNPQDNTLSIKFKNGSTYVYHEAHERDYHNLITADSAGKYFNSHIRDRYKSTKIEKKHH